MKRTTSNEKVDVEIETIKQDIISIIQNSTDKVKISRVYEALTGHSTQSHPTDPSRIRIIT